MAAICWHHALLAAVGRSVPQTTLGARRHAGASFPFSTTPRNYPRRLVSRAAISIPPDALVHPKRIKDDQGQWGIDQTGDKDEVVKLWFLITGVSNVQKEVEVNLPDGSNVLTIKKKKGKEKMKAAARADELLDVRLLLTEDYDRKGIEVKGRNEEGKVRLEVTITQKATTPFHKIDIN